MTATKLRSTLPLAAKRQFCRKGIHGCVPAVTLIFSGNRRLHWCAEHASDAKRYAAAAIDI